MVISSLNTTRIIDLVGLIQSYVEEIKPFAGMSMDEFLSDKRNPAFVESYLRRSLEAVFDAGRHIVSKLYGIKEPEYKLIAKELGSRGVVTEALSLKLYAMAGYRNRMVHFYNEIKEGEIYEIMINHLGDFDEFIKEISIFLKYYMSNQNN
ncbi:MAG: type VII toxin-antitoxin system HepT family RNase toxin [bacterium]